MNLDFERARVMSQSVIRSGALAVALALGGFAAEPAYAGDAPAVFVTVNQGEVKSLQLGVGRSVIVNLPEDAKEIFVGDPTVADAIVRSARRIYITTKQSGQSSIFALGADGRKIAVVQVSVGRDVGELVQLFKAAMPDSDIHVRTVGGSIILTGSVSSAGDAQQALDLAEGFLSSSTGEGAAQDTVNKKSKVVNSLMIRGLDQVSLRVTISEIRRDIIKQLGVSYSGAGQGSSSTFGTGVPSLGIGNGYGVNGQQSNSATIGWNMAGEKLSATLAAFEQQGVAHTLAEPTVTATSGERAKFLAGGTIPIPASETCNPYCQLGYVQQPYGVTLNFTPVVLSQGRIQLRIATEVTDIDYSKHVLIADTNIPGFRTRRNETTVELPSGGSIVSAGLLATQSNQDITGLPGLMNLPVLGALFRSRDYQRQETELLIIVTPYIVHAVDPKDVVRPDQNYADSSDPQAWLLGRVNRIYSTSGGLKPMPNYTGKVGFITD